MREEVKPGELGQQGDYYLEIWRGPMPSSLIFRGVSGVEVEAGR
jgi:hypothetical protein